MNTPTFDCSICKGNYSVRMTYYRGRSICGWCGYEIEFGVPTTDFKKLIGLTRMITSVNIEDGVDE